MSASLGIRRITLVVLAALGAGAGATALAQGQTDAPPPCFGAAARDTQKPCTNARLRLVVTPTPDDALIEPNSECIPVSVRVKPFVCSFGAAPPEGTQPADTIAVVGDSHAANWRAALDPIAHFLNWRGLSLTRSSCPFATSTPILEEPNRSNCLKWNPQVQKWLARHTEVSTVFIAEHIGVGVEKAKGKSAFETKVAGYMKQWRAIPASVKRVVVINDAPRATGNTADCVARAIRQKKRAGSSCAVPVSFAVQKDPAVEAARRLNSPRYMSIDLTSFFCSKRLCLPVIGGVLVHKDPGHLTRAYATTLAPYLLRAMAALPAFQPPAAPTPAGA